MERMHTRFELCIAPYKGKLRAEIHDEYWDSHTNMFYPEGHPELATGIGQSAVPVKAWKALAPRIATLGPGWYAVEMPSDAYPFGDTFHLIRIPGPHLRYRNPANAELY